MIAIFLSVCMSVPTGGLPSYAAGPPETAELQQEAPSGDKVSGERTAERQATAVRNALESESIPDNDFEDVDKEATKPGNPSEEKTDPENTALEDTGKETAKPENPPEEETNPQDTVSETAKQDDLTEGGELPFSDKEDKNPEETTVSSNQGMTVSENTVSENKVTAASVSYFELTAEPGAIMVTLTSVQEEYNSDIGTEILYTEDMSEDLSGDENGLLSIRGTNSSVKEGFISWHQKWEDGRVTYTCNYVGLKPDTNYQIAIAGQRSYDSSTGMISYYRKSNVLTITTKKAPTEHTVGLGEVKADSGYYRAALSAVLKNPDNQDVKEVGFAYKTIDNDYHREPCYDRVNQETGLFEKEGWKIKEEQMRTVYPYAEIPVWNSETESVEIEIIYGNPVTIVPQDINKANMQVEITGLGVSTVQVSGTFYPFYETEDIYLYILFAEEKNGTYQENSKIWVPKNSDHPSRGKIAGIADGFTPNKTFWVKAAIGDYTEVSSIVSEPVQITFEEDKTYTLSEIFPDEVFRKLVIKQLNSDTDTVTSSQLERIEYLNLEAKGEDTLIKNLEGIQYLKGLHNVDLRNHDFTEAKIEKLKGLQNLSLNNNDLTSLPDLSALTNLEYCYLASNRIPVSEFNRTNPKLPAKLRTDDWLASNFKQRETPYLNTMAAYYAQENRHPFYFELVNGRNRGNYTVTAIIDGGTPIVLGEAGYNGEIYKGFGILDLPVSEGTHTVKLSVSSDFGGEKLEETKQITFVGDIGTINTDCYAGLSDTDVYVEAMLPVSKENVSGAVLKNKNGEAVGKSSNVYGYTSTYSDERYISGFFEGTFPYQRNIAVMSITVAFARTLQAGSYDLEILSSEGNFSFPDILSITEAASVSKVFQESDYKEGTEYIYITVQGTGLDPEKIWPVLKYKGEEISEKDTCVPNREGYVYRLKKKNWPHGNFYADYEFAVKEGYEYQPAGLSGKIHISSPYSEIYKLAYNKKTKKVEAYFTDETADGVTVSAELLMNYNDKEAVAEASAAVKNGMLELEFKNGDIPYWYWFQYYNYVIRFTYELNGIVKQELQYVWMDITEVQLDTPEAIQAGENTIAVSCINYAGLPDKGFSVQLYQGDILLGSTNLSKSEEITNFYRKFESYQGTVVSDRPFEAGAAYTIKLLYQGIEIKASDPVYGYEKDTKWYIGKDNWAYWEGEDYYFYVSTPLPDKAENYEVKIFDLLGKEMTGFQILENKSTFDQMLYLIIRGLSANGPGYYVKILHKTKGEPYSLSNPAERYYSNEYGKWMSYNSYVNMELRTGYEGYDSVIGSENAFPVQVKVMRPGTVEVLADWSFSKPGEEITKTQLLQLPDPDAVYSFSLLGKNGVSNYLTGTIDIDDATPDPAVTSVTLDKTSVTLSKGETFTLTATVKPADALQKVLFSSSNPLVAEVDAIGRITALAAGETVITASAGEKSAKCTVKVVDISLDSTEVVLIKGASHQIVVTGAVGTPVYKSSNSGVAAVDGKGKITAAGTGKAVVFVTADGVTLTVNVTVKAVIEGFGLGKEEMQLKVGSMEVLQARIQPLEAASDVTISWSSSDPSVIQVVPDSNTRNASVQALAVGKSVVTAETGNFKASCEITVKKSVQKEVPQGLYAVTNVTPALTNDILGTSNTGWSFVNADGSVALTAQDYAKIQYFDAVYTETDAYPYETKVPVAVSNITGVTVVSGSGILVKGRVQPFRIKPSVIGAEVPAEAFSVKWSSKNKLVSFDNAEALDTKVSAMGEGQDVITAKLTVKGTAAKGQKTEFTLQYPVTVLSNSVIEEIRVKDVTNGASYSEGSGVLKVPYGEGEAFQTGSSLNIQLEAIQDGAVNTQTGFTCEVSDKTVAEAAMEDRTVSLKLKKEGHVLLTVTAKDAGGYRRNILIRTENYSPQLENSNITVNVLKYTGTQVKIYPAYENKVKQVQILDESGKASAAFEAEMDGTILTVKAKNSQTAAGSYKNQQLKLDCENGKTYTLIISVKAENKKPSAKLKAVQKANLFYVDSEAVYEVNSDAEIENITWDSGKTTGARLTGSYQNGKLVLTPVDVETADSNTLKAIQKGIVTITYQGYEESTKQVLNMKAPLLIKKAVIDLDKKQTVLYPGIQENSLTVIDKATKMPILLDSQEDTAEKDMVSFTAADGLEAGKKNGRVFVRYTGDKALTAKIKIQLAGWRDSIELKHRIVLKQEPETELTAKTLILNTDCTAERYDPVSAGVLVKGNAYAEISELNTAQGMNQKAQELLTGGKLSITPDVSESCYQVALNGIVPKGSYKYQVGGSIVTSAGAIEMKPAVLTVKVSEKAPAGSVKTSGTINLADRNNTFVTCNIRLADITDSIHSIKLTGAYQDAYHAVLTADNKVLLQAKEESILLANTNYKLQLKLTLASGYEITTKTFQVRPQQKIPAVAADKKKLVLFASAYGEQNAEKLDFYFKKNSYGAEIERVILINYTDNFEYDDTQGTLFVKEPVNTNSLKTGKTYKLSFRIICKGNAENAKPTIVKVPVKLMK